MANDITDKIIDAFEEHYDFDVPMIRDAARSHMRDCINSELEEYVNDKKRLTRELDVLLNGVNGAAKQASLCDVVAQVARSTISEVTLGDRKYRIIYIDDGEV